MPRDGNGRYVLPAGNPVISGTVIDTAWANPTMEDIANALTNSLSRTGNGGMLTPMLFANGSVGQPGISWQDEPNSGFYRAGNDDMRVSVNGVAVMQWTPLNMIMSTDITASNGYKVNANLVLASTALQSGGNVSELTNDVPYATTSQLSGFLSSGDNISELTNDAHYATTTQLSGYLPVDGSANMSGTLNNTADLVAFFGSVAVNANRAALNASGKVTAYDMIDHLLDKIEELETLIAAIT